MKKNVVGHMMAAKEPVAAKLRRWCILPRVICLLLAVLIWLAIVNVENARDDSSVPDNGESVQSYNE